MKKITKLGIAVAALSLQAAQFANAEINDTPRFNLWSTGVTADGATGNGTSVQLCGTFACSTNPAAPINYAVFRTVDKNTGKGSGAIDPFLRFQHNEGAATGSATIERAFNTNNPNVGLINNSNGTFDTINQAKDSTAGGQKPPGDFNHAIKLSTLLASTDGGAFFDFFLDINEPGSGKSVLRLDELALFISTSDQMNEFKRDAPGVTTATLATATFTDSDAVAYKVWDMDFNEGLAGTKLGPGAGKPIGGLNLNNIDTSAPAGSGDYDMNMRVKKALFDQVLTANAGSGITADNAYVYLYNFAGETAGNGPNGCSTPCGEAQAGFEEWAAVVSPTTTPPGGGGGVPEPGTALLMLGGIAGLLKVRQRRPKDS